MQGALWFWRFTYGSGGGDDVRLRGLKTFLKAFTQQGKGCDENQRD